MTPQGTFEAFWPALDRRAWREAADLVHPDDAARQQREDLSMIGACLAANDRREATGEAANGLAVLRSLLDNQRAVRYHLLVHSGYSCPTASDVLAPSIRRTTYGGPMHEIRRRRSNQRLAWTAVHWIVALLVPVTARPVAGQAKPEVPDLSQVRSALEKYKDPYVAIHDGYFSTLGCVEFERPGAAGHVPYRPGGMGVHFLKVGLIGPVPDPAKPQVLLYEPDGDKLRLVGAEWFIPLSTGVKTRPTLWSRPFDGPMVGHPPLLPMEVTHYDLHVWLYKPNPLGTFAPTNPDVKCTGYPYRLVEEAPKLVPDPKP